MRNRWPLLPALILVGLSGGAVAVQNVFPKWLFSYVLAVDNLAVAERWRRLAWLAAGYLMLTSINASASATAPPCSSRTGSPR